MCALTCHVKSQFFRHESSCHRLPSYICIRDHDIESSNESPPVSNRWWVPSDDNRSLGQSSHSHISRRRQGNYNGTTP